ncbi:hypothetical protein GOP47_0021975 [Adiantum capillus-veneris]|uniref:Plant bHLH transcription factor ACT-like domain-containing protein n=1 Tax=Adiantum capillus-veneris TaxID=13818 RepID=A0A9D4Z5Q6_ADICA|nr:hypothetical protein GOP47_0021975 [Adiantum capillus-veneris]
MHTGTPECDHCPNAQLVLACMAVTTLSMNEQHHEDITQGISACSEEEDEERIMDCNAIRASDDMALPRQQIIYDHIAASHVSLHSHLHRLRKRISKTHHGQLSPQAILLLGEAAATSNYTSPSSSPINIDPSTAPLYAQLQSLRELIPPQPTKGVAEAAAERSPPCLITHALDYLDHMKLEIRNLHESIHQLETSAHFCSNQGSASYMDSELGLVKVEPTKDSKLHIHVQCKQRKGLLSSLLSTLEDLGLVIDQMDVSSNQMLTLDLIASKVQLKRFDQKYVVQAICGTISPDLQDT